MSTGGLSKVTAKTAQEVCQHFPLGDDARKLLRDGMTPRQFLDAVTAKALHLDAIRFLAHALPKREAVWWACLCVRQACGPNLPPKAAAAVQAAEKWVRGPTEETRRAAQAAAEAAELGTPAGCAAMAAFWSDGSLGPPNVPVIPPPPYLTGHGAAGSILLAAVASQPEKAPERHQQFLKLGLEVAAGTNKWG